MFTAWLKKRRLRPCLSSIPFFLKKTWGKSNVYSLGQVRTSYEQQKIPLDSIPYSVALFCSPEDFELLLKSTPRTLSREALLADITALFCPGKNPLSGKEVIESLKGTRNDSGDHFNESGAGLHL